MSACISAYTRRRVTPPQSNPQNRGRAPSSSLKQVGNSTTTTTTDDLLKFCQKVLDILTK